MSATYGLRPALGPGSSPPKLFKICSARARRLFRSCRRQRKLGACAPHAVPSGAFIFGRGNASEIFGDRHTCSIRRRSRMRGTCSHPETLGTNSFFATLKMAKSSIITKSSEVNAGSCEDLWTPPTCWRWIFHPSHFTRRIQRPCFKHLKQMEPGRDRSKQTTAKSF